MSYAIMFVIIFVLSFLFLDRLERISIDIPSEFDGDPVIANEKYKNRILDDIYTRHTLRFY